MRFVTGLLCRYLSVSIPSCQSSSLYSVIIYAMLRRHSGKPLAPGNTSNQNLQSRWRAGERQVQGSTVKTLPRSIVSTARVENVEWLQLRVKFSYQPASVITHANRDRCTIETAGILHGWAEGIKLYNLRVTRVLQSHERLRDRRKR